MIILGKRLTAVGVGQKHRDHRICAPSIADDVWPEAQCEQARQGPYCLKHGNKGSLIQIFRKPCDGEKGNDVHDTLQKSLDCVSSSANYLSLTDGIVNKFVVNVSNPAEVSTRVMYFVGEL